MLRLLWCLACVYLATGSNQDVSLDGEVDISTCPIFFFQEKNERFFTAVTLGQSQTYCFDQSPVGQDALGDCLELPQTPNPPRFGVETDLAWLDGHINAIKGKFPEVSGEPSCALHWDWNSGVDGAGPSHMVLLTFGSLTVMQLIDVQSSEASTVKIWTAGTAFKTIDVPPNQLTAASQLLAGCKTELLDVGAELDAPGCVTKVCTLSGAVEETSKCEQGEVCDKDACVSPDVCVLTANTVIDFSGQSAALDNFCGQVLLKNEQVTVEAFYKERRFSGVPFIDYVKVSDTDGALTLDEGGKISDGDGNAVVPTEGGLTAGGFVLTTVEGGVLLKHSTKFLHVFFDGTTLHMNTKAVDYSEGTCKDVSTNVASETQTDGCDTAVDDPRGENIDCDAVKERCVKVLSEAPFDQCSVDSAAYVAACSNLLCEYPDKDGLLCHLLGAFARSCHLQDWRDTTGCSVSGCHAQRCLDSEFCGMSVGGAPRCFCRESTSAPYRENGKLGGDTQCAGKSASVNLLGCLLEEKGVDPSSLHLNDPDCPGTRNPQTNEYTFSFSDTASCDATVEVDGDKIVYANVVQLSGSDGVISRDDQVSVEFSCAYIQPEVQTMSLKIMDSSVVKVMDSGEWSYVFKLEAFTDDALTQTVASESEVRLNQPLWVRAEATEVDGTQLSLVIEACWATKEDDAEAQEKYELIRDGCSVEESTALEANGAALSSVFTFRVFQFIGSDSDVFLHCDAKLCLKSTGCTKTCGAVEA